MKSLIQKDRIQSLLEQRNGYLILCSGLIILSFLLIILCFSLFNREKIILVPPQVEKTLWITNSEVSKEYLYEMTSYFAFLRLNATPDSSEFQNSVFLRHVDSRYYGVLKNNLAAESERIKAQHISTAFYPANIKVDTKKLIAIVNGDLVSILGNAELPAQRVSYQINYSYNNGRLLVKSFEELKP